MNRHRRRPKAERVEIALERGQVTTVLVGSVVALGLVFLLGVIFGSRIAEASEDSIQEIENDGLPAPVASASVPELTFHDALTTRRSSSSLSPAVENKIPEPILESPKPASSDSILKKPSEPKKENIELPSAKPKEKATERELKKTDSPSSGHEITGFAVQVSSSREESDTHRLADRLQSAGWEVRVVEADLEGRGRWYRVRVGRYRTREEAMQSQAELQREFNLSGLVVSL